MTNDVTSGDEVFSQACVGAVDLDKSSAFYDAALGSFGDATILYGMDKPALLVLTPGNGGAPSGDTRRR